MDLYVILFHRNWIRSISYEIDSSRCHGFKRNPVSHDLKSKHFLENRFTALPGIYT
jgi:hypothetical protein